MYRLFDRPVDLRPMILCRILFGLALVLHYLSVAPLVSMAWGPDGLIGARFLKHVPGAASLARPSTQGFQILQNFDSPFVVWALYFLLILCAFAFCIGLFTRVSGILLLALHFIFHAQNEFLFWGWGELIKPFMLYVLLCPQVAEGFSVDRWRKKGHWRPSSATEITGPIWPMRLLQCHVVAVYMVAAWVRIDDPNWLDGSMLYGIMTDPTFSRIHSDWRAWILPMRIACYGSWAMECAAPLFLWLKKTRTVFAWGLIFMHVGLELLTMVGYWDFIIIAALTTFLKPNLILALDPLTKDPPKSDRASCPSSPALQES